MCKRLLTHMSVDGAKRRVTLKQIEQGRQGGFARLGAKPWFRTFGNSAGPDPAGSTAFWRAAQANDIAAMKLLLARGADPNIRTTHGCSALLVAAGMQHSYQGANMVPEARMDTVKFLVEELRSDVSDRGWMVVKDCIVASS